MQLEEVKQSIDTSDLTCWYQSIYNVEDNVLLGYEALMRSKTHNTLNPMEVFQKAKLLGKHTKLDRHLILMAQQLFRSLRDYSLFINVFPSTMLERGFIPWWDKYSEDFPNIVLEMSESEPISNWEAFKFIVKELKERNVKIAIDDMGVGYSSLQYWIELEPEYIKLDKYFLMDIENTLKKQRIIESIIKLVGDSSQIIIEGIEDTESLRIAKDLGVCYAQGYLLGMPSPITKISSTLLL